MTFSATLQTKQLPVVPGKVIKVDTVSSSAPAVYEIVVGQSILSEAGTLIRLKLGVRDCVIITDTLVGALYSARLEALLAASGHDVLACITVDPGEANKDFANLQKILDKIVAAGTDRHTLIVLLGGGVICDLGGMAASLAFYGLDFVQIPTTLLAQTGNTIDGKMALHMGANKNVLGHFHHPRFVLSDVTLLDSLTAREMRSGYAEILKYGLSVDANFFRWCQAHGGRLVSGDHEAQIYAIGLSCSSKAKMAFQEQGNRDQNSLLDLGRIFVDALEASDAFASSLLYGEAVGLAITMACKLSVRLGLCPTADFDEMYEHWEAVGLPLKPPLVSLPEGHVLKNEAFFTKAFSHKRGVVLMRGIGKAFVSQNVDVKEIRAVWEECVCP